MQTFTFTFTLKFTLPSGLNADQCISRLEAVDCDDALVGIGQSGRLALQFDRTAANALEALVSALSAIKIAIPDARLVEVAPDLVGLSDIAGLLGFSRQNMRKLMIKHSSEFPAPVHDGSATIWHLATVLEWFVQHQQKPVAPDLLAIAKAAMQLNIVKESAHLEAGLSQRLIALTA